MHVPYTTLMWWKREDFFQYKIDTLKEQLSQKYKKLDELRLSHQGKYGNYFQKKDKENHEFLFGFSESCSVAKARSVG